MAKCTDDYYGRYEHLEEAKEACEKDSNCVAIWDSNCNNYNFFLCPLGYREKESSSSCLYINPAGTVTIEIIKMNILQRYYIKFKNITNTEIFFMEILPWYSVGGIGDPCTLHSECASKSCKNGQCGRF